MGGKLRKLQDALDIFDRAPIHTIHGFCQTVLRDFAFENRTVLQSEVIEDAPLYERLLKEQMRSLWPNKYGKDLKKVLRISGFREKKETFLETVRSLGKAFHESAGDRLLPDLQRTGFHAIEQEIHLLEREMGNFFKEKGAFSGQYEQLNLNKAAKNSILEKIVRPLDAYFHSEDNIYSDTEALLTLIARIQSTVSSGRKGIDCLIPTKWNKGGPNLHVCPHLEALHEKLHEISRKCKELECSLVLESIHQLQEDVASTKRSMGIISYDDMLALVEKALYADNASLLLEKLRIDTVSPSLTNFRIRTRYSGGYLKGSSWKIPMNTAWVASFLIGDPKQAIYSFQARTFTPIWKPGMR